MRQSILHLSILALILNVAALSAQQAIEVRVPPDDPPTGVLPLGGAIADAATLHGTTVAVMGASLLGDQDSVIPLLTVQIIRNGAPAGSQYTLTSPEARPFRAVSIVRSATGFLVYWNDYRGGATAMYSRRLDANGAPIDVERKMSDYFMLAHRKWAIGDSSVGQAIIFQRYDTGGGGIFMRRIDPDGRFIGSTTQIMGTIWQVLAQGRAPGYHVIRPNPEEPGRIVHSDGTIDPRTIPLDSSRMAFHISPDSALATLDVGGLRLFHSMFDTAPYLRVPIHAFDSLVSYAATISRPSDGSYQVIFAAMARDVALPKRLGIYRVRVTEDGIVSAPEAITSYSWGGGASAGDPGVPDLRMGSRNTYQMRFTFPVTLYAGTDSAWTRNGVLDYRVDTLGQVRLAHAYGPGMTTVDNEPAGFLDPDIPRDPTRAEPVPSDTAALARVIIGLSAPDTLLIAVPTARIKRNLNRAEPSIWLVDGELLAEWKLADGSHELARWGGREAPAVVIDRVMADTIAPLPLDHSRSDSIFDGYMSSVLEVPTPGSFPLLAGSVLRVDNISYLSSPGAYREYTVVQSRNYLLMGTGTGWKRIFNQQAGGPQPNDPNSWMRALGWNPNRREFSIVSGIDPGQDSRMSAYGPDGNESWIVPSTADRLPMLPVVPVGVGTYMMISDEGATGYNGTTRTSETVALPDIPSSAILSYQRLLGPSFLRMGMFQPREQLRLERFDLSAAPLDSITLEFPTSIQDPYLLQDGRDSTLILLYIRDGLRMTRLTQTLHVQFKDSLILMPALTAAMPRGIVRNDTLFVLWTATGGTPANDVHGAWVKLAEYHELPSGVAMTGEAGASASGLSLAAVSPNPTSDRFEVAWNQGSRAEVTLEVVDPLGRVVELHALGELAAGAHRTTLRADALPTGAYLVRLTAGGDRISTRLVVAR